MTFARLDPRNWTHGTASLPCFGFVKDQCPACHENDVYVTYHLRNECPVVHGGDDDDDDDE